MNTPIILDINEINDILLEIKDLGYVYFIQTGWWSDKESANINIHIFKNKLTTNTILSDISETILRLNDYLKLEEYLPQTQTKKWIDDILIGDIWWANGWKEIILSFSKRCPLY